MHTDTLASKLNLLNHSSYKPLVRSQVREGVRPGDEPVPSWLERRFGWIEASLRFAGRFGVVEKKAYRDVFGLTEGMVSRDQDRFCRVFNESCGFEAVVKKRGRLEPVADRPWPDYSRLPLPGMTRWLSDTLSTRFEDVPPIRRGEPRHNILQPVVQAIGSQRPLRMTYRSRSGEENLRTVSPHSIVHVAGRLHMRGWDHGRNAPRDFILSRMVAAVLLDGGIAYVGFEQDREWAERVTLEIRPREGEDLAALKADFDLDEFGIALRRVRRAHMRYLLDEDAPEADAAFRSPVTVRQRQHDA